MKYEEYTTNGNARSRSAAEIDSDLTAIRSEMSETLRHLEDLFSPRALLDQLFSRARGVGRGSSDFAGNLGATVRDNPVPVLLLASGVVSLLAAERGGRTQGSGVISGEGREKLAEGREKIGEVAGEVGERARGLRERAGERASEVGERAGELRERVHETGTAARERVRGMVDQARERGRSFREEPLVIVGLGLALGAMLGASLPVSEREKHIVRREGEGVLRRGEGVVGRAKQAVQQGVERVKEVAVQGTEGASQHAPGEEGTPAAQGERSG